MIKSVVAIFVMLLTTLVVAQDDKTNSSKKAKPDLSGRWTHSFTKDNRQKKVVATDEIVIVVRHLEPEIKFVENAGGEKEQELNYYTDGRGEENLFELSINTTTQRKDPAQVIENLKSKTKWDGEKLVTRAHLRSVVNGTLFVLEIVKECRLSKDGSTLTITTRMTNPDPNPDGSAPAGRTGGWGPPTTSGRTNANPNSSIGNPGSMAAMLRIPFISETHEVYRRDVISGTK